VKFRPSRATDVEVFRPDQPEARDEGPRLLPLSEEQASNSRLEHYIRLADIALRDRTTHEKAFQPEVVTRYDSFSANLPASADPFGIQ
jgi:hypothetical protein